MSDPMTEVEAAEDQRWAAQLAADTEALSELLADELSYTHSNGLVDTKASFLDAIANKVFDYRSADRSDVNLNVIGDTAVIAGRVAMLVVAGSREVNLDSRYSAVWARRDGRWQFVCWQSTPIPA
ncbi:MAG: nuclear transport factor 2 family protein [Actinomycetota bacterium]